MEESIQIKGISIDQYRKYCQDTIEILKSLDTNLSDIEDIDANMISLELENTITHMQNAQENIKVTKQLDENMINNAVELYNTITTDLDKLKQELDTELSKQVVEIPKNQSMNVLSKLIFGMLLLVSIYQILGLGDIVQGSLTATGAIMTTSANKIIKTSGIMIAAAGVTGSMINPGDAIQTVNAIANKQIVEITSIAQEYSSVVGEGVVAAFRRSITLLGDIKGNVFEWIGSGKPEIAGLIGPGPSASADEGFKLTEEAIRILDQSSNIYNTLLKQIALKLASPPEMALTVWEPSKKLLMDGLAKTLTNDPTLGLGTWFNNALEYVWSNAPTGGELAMDTVLVFGVDILATLAETLSAGLIPASAIQEISRKTGGKIGAAEIRMLLDNAKVYINYAK